MIREVSENDLKDAIDLVNRVFSEFVAVDYSEQGKRTFENYLRNKVDEISLDLKSGHKKMWVYYENNTIVGVISTRDTTHISLLFVDKNHHRRGIAREMLNVVLDDLKKREDVPCITVNSSPYAVDAYERLGFCEKGEQQEKDGIIFVPMIRDL